MGVKKEKDSIGIFVRTYTIPMIVLIIGILVYYGIFRESTKKYVKNNTAQTQQASNNTNNTNNIKPYLPTNQHVDSKTNKDIKDMSKDTSQTPNNTLALPNPQNNINNIGQSPKTSPQIFYVAKKIVNIRKEANVTAPIIARVSFARKVSVKNIEHGWAELESGGFILFELLSKTPLIKTNIDTKNNLNSSEDINKENISEQPSEQTNINDQTNPKDSTPNDTIIDNIDSTSPNSSNTSNTRIESKDNVTQQHTTSNTNIYKKPLAHPLILLTTKQYNRLSVVNIKDVFTTFERGVVKLEYLKKPTSDS